MARIDSIVTNVFGPDGETIDAVQAAITQATASCHEAINRHDWQQVKALADCLRGLERALWTMRHTNRA
jgi:hypothetical protein